jgi:hypothetical protein
MPDDNTQNDEQNGQDEEQPSAADKAVAEDIKRRRQIRGEDPYSGIM